MPLVRKTFEVVADELLARIDQGLLSPGDRIPTIDHLAQEFGVGKSTIREALSQLKAKGLIEARQGEGTFIKKRPEDSLSNVPLTVASDPASLMQLLEARILIERGCVGIAARMRDEQDLQNFEEIIAHMQLAIDQEELSRHYDIAFHMMIAQATKNPYLEQIMQGMSEAMNLTIRDSRSLWLYRGASQTRDLFEEHRSIFEAIQAKNADLAQQRIVAHLDHVRQALLEQLQKESTHETKVTG